MIAKKMTRPRKIPHEQAEIVKTLGQRMKAARELCNLSQSLAAKRLGYSNPSKLSKVEGATDTSSVPLWLILKASQVYDVSVDYLFGRSEDWEVGARATQEREINGWMFEAIEKLHVRDMATLKFLHDRLECLGEVVATTLAAADGVSEALDKVRAMNGTKFANLKAGATLVYRVERNAELAQVARGRLARLRLECRLSAPQTSQLSLALADDGD